VAGHLFKIGKKVLAALQATSIKCEGANLFLSDGHVAGQEVMHSHLHIAPRFIGDGQTVGFRHADSGAISRERLNEVAQMVQRNLPATETPEVIPQPRLKTKRLILEPYSESDIDDIFNYASSSEVSRYVPWESHKSLDDSKTFFQFIQRATSFNRGKLFFVFAIRLKETGRVIGSIDFKNAGPRTGQLDYALGFDHWNRGIMSEAAGAVRDWALTSLPELVRLQAFCVAENVGSSKVMEKIGMTFEGKRRKAFLIKGRPVDLLDYSIVRD
jgi:ribosomal-protein-alanine N-acetyltransferase